MDEREYRALTVRIERLPNSELLKLARSRRGEYQKEAVDIATRELSRRRGVGFSPGAVPVAVRDERGAEPEREPWMFCSRCQVLMIFAGRTRDEGTPWRSQAENEASGDGEGEFEIYVCPHCGGRKLYSKEAERDH